MDLRCCTFWTGSEPVASQQDAFNFYATLCIKFGATHVEIFDTVGDFTITNPWPLLITENIYTDWNTMIAAQPGTIVSVERDVDLERLGMTYSDIDGVMHPARPVSYIFGSPHQEVTYFDENFTWYGVNVDPHERWDRMWVFQMTAVALSIRAMQGL